MDIPPPPEGRFGKWAYQLWDYVAKNRLGVANAQITATSPILRSTSGTSSFAISHATSSAIAGTYGGTSVFSQFAINAYGHVTFGSSVSTAGPLASAASLVGAGALSGTSTTGTFTADLSAAGLAAAAGAAWPVGSIFIGVSTSNPATLLGVGTWTAFGAGRILVSLSTSDSDFSTVEGTGGAKTHVQTEAELAAHTHVQDSHNHTQNSHNHTWNHTHNQEQDTLRKVAGGVHQLVTGTGATTGGATAGPNSSMDSTTATNQAATATNQSTGSSSAMNIMNPYIVVYMWKRTA